MLNQKNFFFPYKLYFFKKKKAFSINFFFNSNFLKKSHFLQLITIFYKMLNLKKGFYFFIYILKLFEKKKYLIFSKSFKKLNKVIFVKKLFLIFKKEGKSS